MKRLCLTMSEAVVESSIVRKFHVWQFGVIALSLSLIVLVFFDGLELMVLWWERDEYSHGYILPLVTLFLIWQKSPELSNTLFTKNWYGAFVVLFGLLVCLIGELATLYTVIQYGFLITLAGLALSLMGWKAFRIILVPFCLLFFMIPLPNFVYNNLSAALQLISSSIGVDVIRMFGITVFLEGNVIDLGSFKLQVVEACSGLRYLFPLMSLGYIMLCVFKASIWKKVIIFLSTIPLTVFMNSFRIGVIGVLVEYWGPSMAEGFLHDFEGWIVFMACLVLLVIEMWLLSMVGKNRMPLREAFAVEAPLPPPKDAKVTHRVLMSPFYVSFVLLFMMAIVSQMLPHRAEFVPERVVFDEFPEQLGSWQGRIEKLDDAYVDVLKFDDHIIVNFANKTGESVNLYVAYYASQRKGASVHSPRACLPGGGWKMTQFEERTLDTVTMAGKPLRFNRSVIELGDSKQLVYYWFQQRGRVLSNEYLVKWYLFWDALTKNRSDGALVRLVAPVGVGQDVEDVDRLLMDFAQDISGELDKYIPE